MDNENLFDKALKEFEEIWEDKDELAKLFIMMFGDRYDQYINNLDSLARDGMPTEIITAILGAHIVGFYMGKRYFDEQNKISKL